MADLKTIGVIGAGQMGNGIAHVSALAGYDVILSDISEESLAKGMKEIERNMARQVGDNTIRAIWILRSGALSRQLS